MEQAAEGLTLTRGSVLFVRQLPLPDNPGGPKTSPGTSMCSCPLGCVAFVDGRRCSLDRDRCGYPRSGRGLLGAKIDGNATPSLLFEQSPMIPVSAQMSQEALISRSDRLPRSMGRELLQSPGFLRKSWGGTRYSPGLRLGSRDSAVRLDFQCPEVLKTVSALADSRVLKGLVLDNRER